MDTPVVLQEGSKSVLFLDASGNLFCLSGTFRQTKLMWIFLMLFSHLKIVRVIAVKIVRTWKLLKLMLGTVKVSNAELV